jgi:hypothetical protein
MDTEETYWLEIGEGQYQYTVQASVETYMAMERVCGMRDDIPSDKINKPMTNHFMVLGDDRHQTVHGWSGVKPRICGD